MPTLSVKHIISPRSSVLAGGLLLLAGFIVEYGWVSGNAEATRFFFKRATITVIAALGFILTGTACLTSLVSSRKPKQLIHFYAASGSLAIGIVGTIGIFSDVFSRVLDLPPQFWKMNPVYVFVFFMAGIVVSRLSAPPTRVNTFLIRAGTVFIAASGILLMLNELINTDYIFMNSSVKAPGLGGAPLMVAAAVGIWGLWRDAEWNKQSIDGTRPSHIYFAMDILVTLIVITVALIAFGLSQGRSQDIMMDQMSQVAKDKRIFFEASLSSAYGRALQANERPVIAATLDAFREGSSPRQDAIDRLMASVRSIVKRDLTALSVTDRMGNVVATTGKFALNPEQRIKLLDHSDAELLWDDGYLMRTYMPVMENGREVGHMTSEQRLPHANLHASYGKRTRSRTHDIGTTA
jgi:hypothetical protein